VQVLQQIAQLLAGPRVPIARKLAARALECLTKARTIERFQQVIERMGFKGAHRIAVVGRHENHGRQALGAQGFEHAEAI